MSDASQAPDHAPVVVTGANRHVGAHLAHRFIDDGYHVIAQYRSHTDEIDRLSQRGARLVQGEFSDTAACLDIAGRIGAMAPRLRALVHNASAFSPTADDSRKAGDQFQQFFDVHMRAPYLLNTHLTDHLYREDQTPGDIVHITDIYADNPAPEYDIYCATKAGLQNLAIAMAKRLAPGIKLNVIQPGPLSFEDWVSEADRQQMVDATPLGRTGRPEDIYRAIRALMDNAYQTGAIVAVDGGRRWGG